MECSLCLEPCSLIKSCCLISCCEQCASEGCLCGSTESGTLAEDDLDHFWDYTKNMIMEKIVKEISHHQTLIEEFDGFKSSDVKEIETLKYFQLDTKSLEKKLDQLMTSGEILNRSVIQLRLLMNRFQQGNLGITKRLVQIQKIRRNQKYQEIPLSIYNEPLDKICIKGEFQSLSEKLFPLFVYAYIIRDDVIWVTRDSTGTEYEGIVSRIMPHSTFINITSEAEVLDIFVHDDNIYHLFKDDNETVFFYKNNSQVEDFESNSSRQILLMRKRKMFAHFRLVSEGIVYLHYSVEYRSLEDCSLLFSADNVVKVQRKTWFQYHNDLELFYALEGKEISYYNLHLRKVATQEVEGVKEVRGALFWETED
jgi:hypothetical protein